jgi:hypothetical protein
MAHNVSKRDASFVQSNQGAAIPAFVYLGAKHMVTGYDHIAFLVGVIFFLYRLKDIVQYVSLFHAGAQHHFAGWRARGSSREPLRDRCDHRVVGGLQSVRQYGRLPAISRIRTQHESRCIDLWPVPRIRPGDQASGAGPGEERIDHKHHFFNVGVEIGQVLALTAVLIALSVWRTQSGFLRQAFTANAVLMTVGFVLVGYQVAGYFVAA